MRRKRVERLIDDVRAMLAEGRLPAAIERVLLLKYEVQPLTRCDGQGHESPTAPGACRAGAGLGKG
jgi:hypothetical protein